MNIVRLSRFNDACRPYDPISQNTLITWCKSDQEKPIGQRKLPGAFYTKHLGWQVDVEMYQDEIRRRAAGCATVDKIDDPVLAKAKAILKGVA